MKTLPGVRTQICEDTRTCRRSIGKLNFLPHVLLLQATQILEQVAQALAYLHELLMVHRDLKASGPESCSAPVSVEILVGG